MPYSLAVEGIKKVRRYWMDKKKAAQFHSQLAVLFMQVRALMWAWSGL